MVGAAASARDAFVAAGGSIALTGHGVELPDADVHVDGLFGSGLSRDVDGIARELIEALNARRANVLALDVPSGLDADRGVPRGIAVRSMLAGAVLAAALWTLPSRAQDAAPVKPPPLTVETPASDAAAAQPDDDRPRKRHRRSRGETMGEETGAGAKPGLPPAMAVTVQGRSKPTLCAEDDNVYLTFSSSTLRHFRIDARPPSAIGTLAQPSIVS